MRSAPRDKPGDTGDVVLSRTAGQTLWWVLGHPVSIAGIAAVLATGVIAASAMAAASARPTPGDAVTPTWATEAVSAKGSTDATIVLSCPADAQLTVTATGTGPLELTVDGPTRVRSVGNGKVAATITGPAGAYTARVRAAERLDKVAWSSTSGACAG